MPEPTWTSCHFHNLGADEEGGFVVVAAVWVVGLCNIQASILKAFWIYGERTDMVKGSGGYLNTVEFFLKRKKINEHSGKKKK